MGVLRKTGACCLPAGTQPGWEAILKKGQLLQADGGGSWGKQVPPEAGETRLPFTPALRHLWRSTALTMAGSSPRRVPGDE